MVFSIFVAVFIGLFALTLLTFTTSLFDAPSQSLNQFDLLSHCFTVAASLWLLANGVHTDLLGSSFEYMPLGLTLILFALLYFCLHPRQSTRLRAVVVGAFTYVGIVIFIYALGTPTGDFRVLLQLLVAFTIAFTALLMANASGSFFTQIKQWRRSNILLSSVPRYLTKSIQSALLIIAFLLILSALLAAAGLIVNIDAVQIIFDRLNAGPGTAVVISLFTCFFLPNFIIYNLGMLLGQGFTFGNLAYFSLHLQNDTSADLNVIPPLPILGSTLQSTQLGIHPLVPYILLAICGIAASVWLARSLRFEYLFPAFTKVKLCVSQSLYLLLACTLVAFFGFIASLTLAHFASGILAPNFGFVGVPASTLAFKVGGVLLFSTLPTVAVYIIYKAVTLKPYQHSFARDAEDSAIIMLRKETIASLEKEIQHEKDAAGHRAKGNRRVTSTYSKFGNEPDSQP